MLMKKNILKLRRSLPPRRPHSYAPLRRISGGTVQPRLEAGGGGGCRCSNPPAVLRPATGSEVCATRFAAAPAAYFAVALIRRTFSASARRPKPAPPAPLAPPLMTPVRSVRLAPSSAPRTAAAAAAGADVTPQKWRWPPPPFRSRCALASVPPLELK
jgi:hypothetical protein